MSRISPTPAIEPRSPGADVVLASVYSDKAFRGRVYGVTGGAHGIGEATVRQLMSLGASVVIADIDQENLDRVRHDLARDESALIAQHGDIADPHTMQRAVKAAMKKWGRVDGWVNNAMHNPGGFPGEISVEELDRTWQINVRAAWVSCELLLPIMRDAGGGSIVNISSILAHQTQPNNTPYGMTKLGVEGLTRGLATDLARFRIRVNCIVPGAIDTSYKSTKRTQPADVPDAVYKKHRARRAVLREHNWRSIQHWPTMGQPGELAAAILFFLSDASCFVTGTCLPVDGGAGVTGPNFQHIRQSDIARVHKAHRATIEQYPSLRFRQTHRHLPGHQASSNGAKKRRKP